MHDHSHFKDWFDSIPEGAKHLIDLLSITALLGSLVSVLPALASILTITWTALRIYETKTVQSWLTRSDEQEN